MYNWTVFKNIQKIKRIVKRIKVCAADKILDFALLFNDKLIYFTFAWYKERLADIVNQH